MLIVKIALGLLGLGIVVFFHELGHFLAARLVGINVEAFSIGWGKPFLKKKIGNCEYRLGIFPIGGYCKMQGESDYSNEAYKKLQEGILPEKGSYLAAPPLARILVSFAGPFFNLVLAVILFSFIWGIGFEINTYDNRVNLSSELNPGEVNPADIAGIKSGDRIINIDNRNIEYFHEIRENIAINADKPLSMIIERNGEIIQLNITPSMEKESGRGLIGIYPYNDELISYHTPKLSLPGAIVKGTQESYRTLVISVTSLRLLFKGIDLTQAVSGPVRITYMMGDFAAQGFNQSVGTGLHIFVNFISLISIALCVMNLLPLPILDGGMIILFLIEMIRRKPAHPKAIAVFQTCGMVIIFSLFVFALFGDIMFFVNK